MQTKIKLFETKENCCGCTACMNICPQTAISMAADVEGFLYPVIDEMKCVGCGLCQKVCAFQNQNKGCLEQLQEPIIYAVKNRDESIRSQSRSGGMFVAVAQNILNKGGTVYGAAYEGKFVVAHKRINHQDGIKELQGSKYVQSDLGTIYRQVKSDLEQNKYVLFSGTPCQVAGLYSFFGDRIDLHKLVTMDLVCHGVPSPLIWKEYIDFCECKYKGQITEVNFRDKTYGWDTHFETFKINNKKYTSRSFARLFNLNGILRPACHQCPYTCFERPSDLTIGDFWGIETCMPEFDDNKGVSLVLVNSTKGEKLFEEVTNQLQYHRSTKTACLQPQLQYPSDMFHNRGQFWEDYHLKGFKYILKKYARGSIKNRLKVILMNKLR